MTTYAKYHNTKVEYDGRQFDSRAEARRYQQLRVLEASGQISNLTVHPRFVLLPGFRDNEGKRQRAVTYSADFCYTEGGRRIAEDVKGGRGTETQVFRLKAKWFKAIYGDDYDLRIVRDC